MSNSIQYYGSSVEEFWSLASALNAAGDVETLVLDVRLSHPFATGGVKCHQSLGHQADVRNVAADDAVQNILTPENGCERSNPKATMITWRHVVECR